MTIVPSASKNRFCQFLLPAILMVSIFAFPALGWGPFFPDRYHPPDLFTPSEALSFGDSGGDPGDNPAMFESDTGYLKCSFQYYRSIDTPDHAFDNGRADRNQRTAFPARYQEEPADLAAGAHSSHYYPPALTLRWPVLDFQMRADIELLGGFNTNLHQQYFFLNPVNRTMDQIDLTFNENISLLSFQLGVALPISQHFSAGVGCRYLLGSFRSTREKEYQYYSTLPPFENYSYRFQQEYSGAAVAGVLGARWRVPDRFAAGLSIISPAVISMPGHYHYTDETTDQGGRGTRTAKFRIPLTVSADITSIILPRRLCLTARAIYRNGGNRHFIEFSGTPLPLFESGWQIHDAWTLQFTTRWKIQQQFSLIAGILRDETGIGDEEAWPAAPFPRSGWHVLIGAVHRFRDIDILVSWTEPLSLDRGFGASDPHCLQIAIGYHFAVPYV